MKRRELNFELKELQESGHFEGYLAVTGNKDRAGDVVDSGAFKKTNKENDTFPLLWQHNKDEPIGVLRNIREDSRGEYVEGELNKDTQKGREAYSLLKQGAIKGLSIGYKTIKDSIKEGARHIKELKLYEGSIVTFPANPQATVETVKSVTELQDMPLASRDYSWDSADAKERVQEWADGDWDKYRKAFMWYDSDDPELYGSYKLPYGDIIDGELKAVPRALFSIAGVLQGAMGGVDVPEGDRPTLKSRVETWYGRMREKFDEFDEQVPWKEKSGLEPSLLQLLGAIHYTKDGELSGSEVKMIEGVVEELNALSTGSRKSSQSPSDEDTLEEITQEFKQIVQKSQ